MRRVKLHEMLLFDFNLGVDITDWVVVNDAVMGGMSSGRFRLNNEGFGVFEGDVSLENNGGFSSVRYRFGKKYPESVSTILLHVKGDGKSYQFRVKSDMEERHSYIYSFKTSGEWEVVQVPLLEMIPKYRGKPVSLPNFDASSLAEIAFLIGNKRNEHFELEIDKVVLQ